MLFRITITAEFMKSERSLVDKMQPPYLWPFPVFPYRFKTDGIYHAVTALKTSNFVTSLFQRVLFIGLAEYMKCTQRWDPVSMAQWCWNFAVLRRVKSYRTYPFRFRVFRAITLAEASCYGRIMNGCDRFPICPSRWFSLSQLFVIVKSIDFPW